MIKLAAFDIDETLAPINGPISAESVELLKKLRKNGVIVILISGKPVAYVSGIARQAGLMDVMVAGGNGELLHTEHVFPPRKVYNLKLGEEELKILKEARKLLSEKLGDKIWFQPNLYQVTAYHYENEAVKAEVYDILNGLFETNATVKEKFKLYSFFDCVDFLPIEISKGNAIRRFCIEEGIAIEDTASVGDSVNDISMFEQTGMGIGINDKELKLPVDFRFERVEEAIEFLINRTRE